MRHVVYLVVFFFALMASPVRAQETGAQLEEITFDRESSVRETIAFKLNGPHLPKIFAVKGDTPKVVFDFFDTKLSAQIKPVLNSRGNLVAAIRVGTHTAPQLKTRVVLDLVPAGDYDFAQDFQEKDNILIISVFHAPSNKGKQQAGTSEATEKTPTVAPAKDSPPPQTEAKAAATPPAPSEEKTTEAPAATPSVTTPPPSAAPPAAAPSNTLPQAAPPPSAAPPVAAPQVGAEKKASVSPPAQVLIHSLAFEQGPDKGEKVLFKLSNFQPPVIFGIEEGMPSIVCDFVNAELDARVPEVISAQGKLIKQIRVEKNSSGRKIRIILELVPNRHYDLQQVYYKEENRYVLFVKARAARGAKGGTAL